MKRKIDSFRGEYRFLSNFFPAEVELDGSIYPTVEHAFQAAKTMNNHERLTISLLKTPGDAKGFGRHVSLRPDWKLVKIDVMRKLIRQKFGREPLRSQLLATDDAELIEGNWWNDTFWGVCEGVGKNWLGKILMEIREEIRGKT